MYEGTVGSWSSRWKLSFWSQIKGWICKKNMFGMPVLIYRTTWDTLGHYRCLKKWQKQQRGILKTLKCFELQQIWDHFYPAGEAGVGIKRGVGGGSVSCTWLSIGSHMAGPWNFQGLIKAIVWASSSGLEVGWFKIHDSWLHTESLQRSRV